MTSERTAVARALLSSARRLDNGHTLVAFGLSAGIAGSTGPTEVYEIDAASQVVWRMIVQHTQVMYRAEPLLSISGEKEVTPS